MANNAPDTSKPTQMATAGPAPKKASLDGLHEYDAIEIIHPKTGQTYGVSVKAFKDLYEPQGFEPMRMADGRLLPDDPRAPKADTLPADNPPIIVGDAQPEPMPDGTVRESALSDIERATIKAQAKKEG